jgi:tricorn protease-like protein
LITGSFDKHVKRISVENREVDKDFGEVCDYGIIRMKITPDGEKLLVGDAKGHLKLISSRDGVLIKDFGRAHKKMITGIMTTTDQRFFLTSS